MAGPIKGESLGGGKERGVSPAEAMAGVAPKKRASPDHVALADVLQALEALDSTSRQRVLSSAAAFYGLGWEVVGGEDG